MKHTPTNFTAGTAILCPVNKQGFPPHLEPGTIAHRWSMGRGRTDDKVQRMPARNAHGWYWVQVSNSNFEARLVLAHESEIRVAN